MAYRKLSNYERAHTWSDAMILIDHAKQKAIWQDLIEFRRIVDELKFIEQKLTNHEIAVELEKDKNYHPYEPAEQLPQ